MSFVTMTSQKTPTITAGAYAAGDALGDKITFLGAGSSLAGGVIQSLTLIDLAKQNANIDLILFSADFTATADNAPFDMADADAVNFVGVISITSDDYTSFNDSSAATVRGVGLTFQTSGLFGQLIARGTPTYAATTDIKIQLGILLG